MPPLSDDLPVLPRDQWAHRGNRCAAPPDLEDAAARFGAPAVWRFRIAMREREFRLLDHTGRDGRWQDATVIISAPPPDARDRAEPAGRADSPDPSPRFVAIAKHWYPPGLHRYPSGTVRPHERVVETAVREAREETGLDVEPVRYLLATEGEFYLGDPEDPERTHPWRSHVFLARPTVRGDPAGAPPRLVPEDVREIREAVWVDPAALDQAVHAAMVATGIGGFRYRVGLQERAHAVLGLRDGPFIVPEGETVGVDG